MWAPFCDVYSPNAEIKRSCYRGNMDKKLKKEIIRELRYLANTLYEMDSFKCDSIAKSLELLADQLIEQPSK